MDKRHRPWQSYSEGNGRINGMSLDVSTLRITPEILSLIAEIDEFKGAWRAIGRIAPERLSSLRRVATIESIGSSTRIEGARLSDRDVERLLANLQLGSLATRDEQEKPRGLSMRYSWHIILRLTSKCRLENALPYTATATATVQSSSAEASV
jgi:hypothetical protein